MTVQPGRRLLLIGAGWAAESLSRQLSEQDIPWLVSPAAADKPTCQEELTSCFGFYMKPSNRRPLNMN